MPRFLLLLSFRNDHLFQLGHDCQHGTETLICDNLWLRKTMNWNMSQSSLITIDSSSSTQECIKPQQEVVQEQFWSSKHPAFEVEFQNILFLSLEWDAMIPFFFVLFFLLNDLINLNFNQCNRKKFCKFSLGSQSNKSTTWNLHGAIF